MVTHSNHPIVTRQEPQVQQGLPTEPTRVTAETACSMVTTAIATGHYNNCRLTWSLMATSPFHVTSPIPGIARSPTYQHPYRRPLHGSVQVHGSATLCYMSVFTHTPGRSNTHGTRSGSGHHARGGSPESNLSTPATGHTRSRSHDHRPTQGWHRPGPGLSHHRRPSQAPGPLTILRPGNYHPIHVRHARHHHHSVAHFHDHYFIRGRKARPEVSLLFVIRVGVRRPVLQSVIACHLTCQTPTAVHFPAGSPPSSRTRRQQASQALTSYYRYAIPRYFHSTRWAGGAKVS